MTRKSVAVADRRRSDDLGPFETVSPAVPIFKNVCFRVEPEGWALRGFFAYSNGRLPTSDAELLRLSGRADEPGDYVFFSYDHMLVFTKHFEEQEAEGHYTLAEGSSAVVVKREVSVPLFAI